MSEVAQGVAASAYLEGMKSKRARMRESRLRAAAVFTALSGFAVILILAVGELEPRFVAVFSWFESFVGRHGWPATIPMMAKIAIPASMLLGLIQLTAAFLVWLERKVAGHIQLRLGPMAAGGWHGWAQTFADAIKLILKETIEPLDADRWVFRLAPAIVFVPAFLAFAPIPFGRGLVAANLDIGLLYVMAISGLSTIGILMAGWGSANKFSMFGGLRAAAQVVSFEIPRLLCIVPIIMWSGTLSLSGIVTAQAAPMWGWFPRWFIFYPFVGQLAFVIYIITTIAETNRVPFDIPEAESELVAGYATEYGGMKFAIFYLTEYAYIFVGSLLGAVLFLGGSAAPLPFLDIFPSWAWLLAKTYALIFIFLWSRWTFPRFRVDRMMDLCWKVFIPWTLVNMLIMGVAIVWRAS